MQERKLYTLEEKKQHVTRHNLNATEPASLSFSPSALELGIT